MMEIYMLLCTWKFMSNILFLLDHILLTLYSNRIFVLTVVIYYLN